MKLVLFGGIQGVGKTTLLSWLEHQFANKIIFLNPGELFRRYFYTEKIQTIEEIEDLIASEIERAPHDATIVAHWHYAVPRPQGCIPQISFARQKRIAHSGTIERVVLLKIEAPLDSVLERRLKDYHGKKRELNQQSIIHEDRAEEEFLIKHYGLFSAILGAEHVAISRVVNIDINTAQEVLHDFFTKLLE